MTKPKRPIDDLLEYWMACGVDLNQGISSREIEEFQRMHGIRLPQDFCALYLRANGMRDADADGHMLSLWPLSRTEAEGGVSQSVNALGRFTRVIFADGMINSQFYALRLYEDGSSDVVVVWDPDSFEDEILGSSFDEFIRSYLREGAPGLPD